MSKKTFTMLFLLVATILNIILTLVLITAFITLFIILLRLVIRTENPTAYMGAALLCFTGGVVLDTILYSRLCMWSIRRFNLGPKLDPRLMGKYYEGLKQQARASGKPINETPKEKPKTVMPKSVLPEEDEWESAAEADDSFPKLTDKD